MNDVCMCALNKLNNVFQNLRTIKSKNNLSTKSKTLSHLQLKCVAFNYMKQYFFC